MSPDPAILRAAEATPPLAKTGGAIRPRDAGSVVRATLLVCAGATAAVGYVSLAAGVAVGFVLLLAAMSLVLRRYNAPVQANNRAVTLLGADDLDGAEAILVRIATGRHAYASVALALTNLGVIAQRRGDFRAAAAMHRAALALYRVQTLRNLRAGEHLARSGLALALACAGELDAAERAAAEPVPLTLPRGLGVDAVARALAALRKDDPRAALDILAASQVLLRNVATGEGAALAEAIEAKAHETLKKLGDPYRADAFGPRLVAVDPVERAYVVRALPGCESVLTDG